MPAVPTTPKKKSFEVIKEEIKNEVDELPKIIEQLKKESPNDDVTKRLSDCHSKLSALQTVKKLAEFADTLDTEKHRNNDILNNLCTGRESFLGFNSETKGYDGTGIVYSDLDRLCDGVMGFLSGVLDAVKDDDAVKTYDKYISGMKLKSVLNTLNTKIGTGRTGLAVSVEQVKEWLGEYNDAITEKTEKVTKKLLELRNNIAVKYTQNITNNASNDLTKQLSTWKQTVADVFKELLGIKTDQIGQLDEALKNKISSEMKVAEKAVKLLIDSADVTGFKDQVSALDSELNAQRERIEKEIVTQAITLLGSLNREFRIMDNELYKLKNVKNDQFDRLSNAIKDARNFVDDEFDRDHKYQIDWYFEKIKSDIIKVYDTLTDKKSELTELIRNAEMLFTQVKSGVQKNPLKQESDASIEYKWNDFKKVLGDAITALTNKERVKSNRFGTLQEMVDKVGTYASRFKDKKTFGTQVMEVWLRKILEENEVVKYWLEEYVKDGVNRDKLTTKLKPGGSIQFESNTIESVAKKIREKVESDLGDSAFDAFEVDVGDDSIDANLEHIKKTCEAFAAALGNEIKDDEIIAAGGTAFITGIANEIEAEILKPGPSGGTVKSNLEYAVGAAISALHAMAKQYATELHQFTSEFALGDNIRKTIQKINSLSTQLTAAAGHHIDLALEGVKQPITKITTLLNIDAMPDSLLKKIGEIQQYVLEKLADICIKHKQDKGSIEYKKDEAGKNMDSLRRTIQDKLTSIEQRVQAFQEELQLSIESTSKSMKNAFMSAQNAVNALQSKLLEEVKNAFKKVTEAVRKHFAEQHKADLLALQSSIVDQKQAIGKIIEGDKKIGVKGLLSKLSTAVTLNNLKLPTDLKLCVYAGNVKKCCTMFFEMLSTQPDLSDHSPRLTPLADALSDLLSTMHSQRHFDAAVSSKLADLHAQLTTLSPANFAQASPLLNVLKAGVRAFHGELAKQYVSRYSGMEVGEMVKSKQIPGDKTAIPPAKPGDDTEITEYGRKCAKVFLTSLGILLNDFTDLKQSCKDAALLRIFAPPEGTKNALADFFSTHGFTIAKSFKTQEGEVNNKEKFTGTYIHNQMLEKAVETPVMLELLKKWKSEKKKDNVSLPRDVNETRHIFVDILHFLYDCLETYYSVSHLRNIERPKSPSSVYQMLVWLTGLPHNRVFSKVSVSDIADLFEKPDKETHVETGDISFVSDDADTLPAHPQPIKASTLTSTIQKVCVDAEDVLTSVLGHGHADGIYAVDFNTNPDGFSYPTAPGACFDMLCDVLNRLYQQLYFVYTQCSNEEPSVSWRDCWYGNQVGGSAWSCNTMQCPDQKGNEIHKQKCNQNCNQIAQCGIKSPLQSFLEDGLPGFLPHSFTKPGCKLECSYSNHRGIPCRTPMGFADISVAASHRQRGEYLKKVLEAFCGKDTSPLTKLCAQLNCLLQKPPQTLGDIFAFYYGYITDYTGGFYGMKKSQTHTQQAFRNAANDAYFCQPYAALDPSILLDNSSHLSAHSKGDLISITGCTSKTVVPCGLYVTSLTQEISKYYSSEHKANHLSWIVYITETFYDLLKKLYDECCKKCGPAGSKCHVKSCDEKCEIKYSDEEEKRKALKDKCHKDACKSIITCSDTYPTLYKYGFTFGNIMGLNSSGPNIKSKRTCKDFCEALKLMLVESSVLIELRKQIDQFLWDIRTPFSYLVLALWSLSLFYLICVMVGRLDLLHVKSHLRIPQSHKITAQSLLAAAQVGRLAKISYLQP